MSRAVRAIVAGWAVAAICLGALALNMADMYAEAGNFPTALACEWFGFLSALAAVALLWVALSGRIWR